MADATFFDAKPRFIFNYIPFVKAHGLNFQMSIVSLIVIVGVSSFMAKILHVSNGVATIFTSIFFSLAVLFSFLILESTASLMLENTIPQVATLNIFTQIICIFMAVIFIMVVFATIFPLLKNYKWQVYQRNGFYIHLIFDRFINVFYSNKREKF